jgi:hypothetical protein
MSQMLHWGLQAMIMSSYTPEKKVPSSYCSGVRVEVKGCGGLHAQHTVCAMCSPTSSGTNSPSSAHGAKPQTPSSKKMEHQTKQVLSAIKTTVESARE